MCVYVRVFIHRYMYIPKIGPSFDYITLFHPFYLQICKRWSPLIALSIYIYVYQFHNAHTHTHTHIYIYIYIYIYWERVDAQSYLLTNTNQSCTHIAHTCIDIITTHTVPEIILVLLTFYTGICYYLCPGKYIYIYIQYTGEPHPSPIYID